MSAADWTELADWWGREVAVDPTYQATVIPLVERLLPSAGLFLDLGCGQGQVMEAMATPERSLIGCDLNRALASQASRFGPVVVAELPHLGWLRPESVDGCLAVLVIEHLPHLDPLFRAAAEATRARGTFVLIANHPYVTAPGSASVTDPTDGEMFWRWGDYLTEGATEERAGSDTVVFYHRPLSLVLNSAARAGWSLREMQEIETPDVAGGLPDAGLPRLLGLAWERTN